MPEKNTPEQIEAQRDKMIADFRQAIADGEKALDGMRNALVAHNWIVECDGVTLTFEIEERDGVNHAHKPRHALPQFCTRFTEHDAKNVAAGVSNGNGTKGQAVLLREALQCHIDSLKSSIELLEKSRPAKQEGAQ